MAPSNHPFALDIDEPSGAAVQPQETLPITLALQGGGTLGAFTWGVLDVLLDVPSFRVEAVSGTSAGAMNAAMVVQGLATGGPVEAKRLLEAFWKQVAVAAGPAKGNAPLWLLPLSLMMAPVKDAARSMAPALSPSQINPLGINPLAEVLEELLDPTAFSLPGAPKLVVAATLVRTGEARLFVGAEITAQVLLASACLPQIFPVVEIDGESYWDGGYSSNPPICALVEAGAPADVILVRTTPVDRIQAPESDAAGVRERTAEVGFGAALLNELRSLAFAQRMLADQPGIAQPALERLRDARLHMIGAEDEFRALKGGSVQDPSWAFFEQMRAIGHRAGERWLSEHLAAVGTRGTVDLAFFAGQELDLTSSVIGRGPTASDDGPEGAARAKEDVANPQASVAMDAPFTPNQREPCRQGAPVVPSTAGDPDQRYATP